MSPDKWPQWALAVLCIAMIVIITIVMAKNATLTPLENALLTFILTAASCFISYLATKIYAEAGFNQVLRDHGVQIARNVMELKSQISSLSDWVSTKRAVLIEEEGGNQDIEAALEHIQLTLRGFQGLADNAVGGIAGVIGDAYNQYEDFLDKITRIRKEAEVETFEITERLQNAGTPTDARDLEEQLVKISDEAKRKVSALAERSSMPIPITSLPHAFTAKCPSCSAVNTFDMIPQRGETKIVVCPACRNRFNAHLSSTQDVVTRPLRTQSGIPIRVENWQQPDNLETEARAILVQTQALVNPGVLTSIIGLVLRVDQTLRASGTPASPYELQRQILSNPDKGCTSGEVRTFLKLAFWGRGFELPDSQPKSFKSNYTNILTEDQLLQAYTRGAIGRLKSVRPVTKAQSIVLSKVLFSSNLEKREPLVASIIAET